MESVRMSSLRPCRSRPKKRRKRALRLGSQGGPQPAADCRRNMHTDG